MEAYLRDKEFLTELCSQRERDIFARVTALDLKGKPIEQIESKVTGGSINIDGSSAVRRTCSLTMVTESLDINEYYWGFKTQIKIEIGLKNNLDKYKDKEIIWFNMGIYLISTFSLSQSTTGITINISGKDKMCQLNGEMGGILMAQTDFGQIESYDEFGNRTLKKIPIQQIITDMIHQYADEDFSKIIIEDIEDYGLNLQTYRGSDPCYLFLLGTEDGARAPEQIETNGNREVFVPCQYDEKLIVQKLYEAVNGTRKIDDDEKQAILNIIKNSEIIEPKHAKAVQLYYKGKNQEEISNELIEKYTVNLIISNSERNKVENVISSIQTGIGEIVEGPNIEAIKEYHDYFYYCYVAAWRVLKYSAKLENLFDWEYNLLSAITGSDLIRAKCARAILNYGLYKATGVCYVDFNKQGINTEKIEEYIIECKKYDPDDLINNNKDNYDSVKTYPNSPKPIDENEYIEAWWESGRRRILRISGNQEDDCSEDEYNLIKSFIKNSDKVYARHARIYKAYDEVMHPSEDEPPETDDDAAAAINGNQEIQEILIKPEISIAAIRDYEKKYGILSTAIEDINATFRTPIALSNLGNQEFNFFFNPGNKLTNEEVTVPVYLINSETAIPYYVRKIEYGSTIGYTITELVYPEDLIANSGETLTSVLDKIKTMLGDFEYFYDVDGNFIFRKQRAYKETYNAEDLLRMEIGLSYEEEYKDENGDVQTRIVDNDNSLFLIQSLDSNIDFEFKDLDLVTQISNNPAIGNVKNDYTVWGNKKGSGDNTIPIHMRYAIDTKPEEYHTIGLTPSRACLLLRVYPDIYSLQAGETEELAVRRLVAAHKARHFYSRVPARMKLQAETLIENYLIPMVNKLINYEVEYPIDNDTLEAAQGLIKTLQDMTVKKVEFDNDQNYKVLKNFFEGGINILQQAQDRNPKEIFNNFNKFLESFNKVIDNLYDWRELIYQMAKDYRFFNQTDEFHVWLEEANPMTCIDGKTGYEQYYIDMEGFWRNIYDKEYRQVKWNDPLQEGTVYIVDDDETEGQGTPVLYNTEKIYYKDDDGNRILMPDFDIYMPAAEGEVTTAITDEQPNEQYKKIGTLYGIVKNNYKILEPVIERYVIDEWMKTHPEMIYRLKGLHPNDEEEYIDSHYLYMKDPMTWLKKRNELSYHYADNETDQMHGFQRPYYHGGELAQGDAKKFDTFVSVSKVPMDSTAWETAQKNMAILKSSSGIEIDTKNMLFPNMTQAEYAYCVINNVGPIDYNDEKENVENKLISLAEAVFNNYIDKIENYLEYDNLSLEDKNQINKNIINFNCNLGLIALAMKEQNIYGINSSNGYVSLLLKTFDRVIAYEIFGKRILKGIDNCNLINFDIQYSLAHRFNEQFNNIINKILDSSNENFINYKIIGESFNSKVIYININSEDKTINNEVNIDNWNEQKVNLQILEYKYDFSSYNKITFFNLISFAGDTDGDRKVTIKDFQQLIEDINNIENVNDYLTEYYKNNIQNLDEIPTLDIFIKEFYYRITFDTSIGSALEKNNFHNQLFSLILNSNVKRILKESYLGWNVPDGNNSRPMFSEDEFKSKVSNVISKFQLINITNEPDSSNCINQSYNVFLNQMYQFLDFDEDGYFSLTDVQKIIKVANEDEDLEQVSDKFKQAISFDGETKATFYKARFIFFIFFLLYNKLDDDKKDNDFDNNEAKERFSEIQEQVRWILSNKIFLVELWILTLTPYAIERTLAGSDKLRTPYWVVDKISLWTWPDRMKAQWTGENINFNEPLQGEDWFHSEVRRRFGRPNIILKEDIGKTNPRIAYECYHRFGKIEVFQQSNNNKKITKEVSRFSLLCWPKDGPDVVNSDNDTHLTSVSKILELAENKNYPNAVSEYEQYLCAQLIDRSELWGDVDNDGKVTARDARIALKYAEEGPTLDEAKKAMEKEKEKAEQEGKV